MAASFRRVAILGTGLIGGSFALALRKYSPDSMVVGWDKAHVLRHALERGAIHEGIPGSFPRRCRRGFDLRGASGGAHHRTAAGNRAARSAGRAGHRCVAARSDRCARWRRNRFHEGGAHFLGGHPMAGKEISGIAAADANLFRGSKYALIRASREGENWTKVRDPRVAEFVALIEKLGAEPIWLDAEAHDRAAAVVSHLPQLLAVALAGVVREPDGRNGIAGHAGGPRPARRAAPRGKSRTRSGVILFSRTATIWSACWIR